MTSQHVDMTLYGCDVIDAYRHEWSDVEHFSQSFAICSVAGRCIRDIQPDPAPSDVLREDR